MEGTVPESEIRRARQRAWVFGIVTVALAAGASWATFQALSNPERMLPAEATLEMKEVVVAAKTLEPGDVVDEEDLAVAKRMIYTSDQHFDDPEIILGRTVGELILEGEPVLLPRLDIGGALVEVKDVIDPGARAMTVRATQDVSVGGLLRPGYFVDVLVTISPESDALDANWVTDTVLQGVRVLAVGDEIATSRSTAHDLPPQRRRWSERMEQPRQRSGFVTLEVTPAEAEALALAVSRGRIHLTMRSDGDFDVLEPGKPLVTNALLGLPDKAYLEQQERMRRKQALARRQRELELRRASAVEIIRGGETTTVAEP